MNTIIRNVMPAVLLLLCGGTLHAEGVLFYEGTWDQVLERAAKENKYIMVDAYTDWCGWCKVMDKETFTDPAVGAVVNENFIPVKINFEKGIGIDLGMKFRVSGYPTILFFNPGGQLVHELSGYLEDNQEFIAECQKALAVKEDRVYAFDSRDLNVPFPEFYRASFLTGDDRAWPDISEVDAFLDAQEDLFSEVSWSVLWRFKGSEKHQKFLLANMPRYKKLYGEESVRSAGLSIAWRPVSEAIDERDEAMLNNATSMVDKYFADDSNADLIKLRMRHYFYERTGEWKEYAQISEILINDERISSASQVNDICWKLYEWCNDQEILTKAVCVDETGYRS